ncbi:MAG: hypothetical protein HUN04_15315 [Desulfobacter sp.]|nr:MAG: hypothetical protein HUN04_15315 [Desulfobacter sp.]
MVYKIKRIAIVLFVLFAAIQCANGQEIKTLSATTLLNFAPHAFPLPGSDKNLMNEVIKPGNDSRRLQVYAWDVFRESLHAMGYTQAVEKLTQ